MSVLTKAQIDKLMPKLPGWKFDGDKIYRELTFPTFLGAINMVERIAELAEKKDHHPDMDIRYNKLKVMLVTHDAGGVTEKDMAMAKLLEDILPKK